MNKDTRELIEGWREAWPKAFALTEIEKLTGGILKRRTMANRKCSGEIPAEVFLRLNGRVIVRRDPLLAWLSSRLEPGK